MGDKAHNRPTSCIACKETPLLRRCPVIRQKTTTDETGRRQQTLLFMLEWAKLIPQRPKTTQGLKTRVPKHSQYLAPWLRKNYSTKTLRKDWRNQGTTVSNVTVVTNKAEEIPGIPSVTNVHSLLQITEVNLQSSFHTEKDFSSVILHAVTRGFPKNWPENWMWKAHLRNLQFTGKTHIKLMTRKLLGWSWHWFIRVALARFLWSKHLWGTT